MLLIIESFCRFVQGKVILNKRVDTMINAIMDTWIMCFGIPSLRFYADNGGEFVNVKIDKLMARSGVTVRYGSTYSPWLNRINLSISLD